ncbi:MAG: hypothetical protein GX808_11420 [Syntrophomonadaceae bacterium]|nr:hypothetical protein [Syntrophomonadaceae bacterium]
MPDSLLSLRVTVLKGYIELCKKILLEGDSPGSIEYSGAVYTVCPVVGNRHSALMETIVP